MHFYTGRYPHPQLQTDFGSESTAAKTGDSDAKIFFLFHRRLTFHYERKLIRLYIKEEWFSNPDIRRVTADLSGTGIPEESDRPPMA